MCFAWEWWVCVRACVRVCVCVCVCVCVLYRLASSVRFLINCSDYNIIFATTGDMLGSQITAVATVTVLQQHSTS